MIEPPYYNIVTEVFVEDGCKHGRYFRIPTDRVGVQFDGKSRRQWNAFFHNTRKMRNRNGNKVWYVTSPEFSWITSWELTKKSFTKHNIPFKEPEFIELACIDDLFPLIGYDYKAKKYL